MAVKIGQGITPSLLDRLFDDEPANSRDGPRYYDIGDLKKAVIRDIANLLNSRQTPLEKPRDGDLANSIFTYGLPDISSLNPRSDQDVEFLRREMERVLRRHEPRLTAVRVETQPISGALALGFRIVAELRAEPHPVAIELSTRLESSAAKFVVRE